MFCLANWPSSSSRVFLNISVLILRDNHTNKEMKPFGCNVVRQSHKTKAGVIHVSVMKLSHLFFHVFYFKSTFGDGYNIFITSQFILLQPGTKKHNDCLKYKRIVIKQRRKTTKKMNVPFGQTVLFSNHVIFLFPLSAEDVWQFSEGLW